MSTVDPAQGFKVSQVALPCDSQGSVDFSSYPFQVSISNSSFKQMTYMSLSFGSQQHVSIEECINLNVIGF